MNRFAKYLSWPAILLIFILYNGYNLWEDEDTQWKVFFIGAALIMLYQEVRIYSLVPFKEIPHKAITAALVVGFGYVVIKEVFGINYAYQGLDMLVIPLLLGLFFWVVFNRRWWKE